MEECTTVDGRVSVIVRELYYYCRISCSGDSLWKIRIVSLQRSRAHSQKSKVTAEKVKDSLLHCCSAVVVESFYIVCTAVML